MWLLTGCLISLSLYAGCAVGASSHVGPRALQQATLHSICSCKLSMNTPPSPAVLRDNAVPSSATIPRALALPEILKLIRGFLAKNDLVRLLTVSHYFFASVVPSVWTVVQGPYILLKLLPNIDTSRIQDATWVEVDISHCESA